MKDLNKKILFLDYWNNNGDLLRKERDKTENIKSQYIYKNDNIFNKVLRRIKILGINSFSFGKWKKEIKSFDVFIIDSRNNLEPVVKYIRNKKIKNRIVVWYWNKLTEREMSPEFCKKYECEMWSFDKMDSEKFKMNFNETYYFKSLMEDNKKVPENDVFYIGLDRNGRVEKIMKLEKYFLKENIKFEFNLVKSPIKEVNKKYEYKKLMTYDVVIDKIKKSKVILDLTQENQYGLTLRPMEALFFEKKLITDNINIVNYEFYNPENIFVLGIDKLEELSNFIKNDYKKIDNKYIEYYDFSNWLQRIINGGK